MQATDFVARVSFTISLFAAALNVLSTVMIFTFTVWFLIGFLWLLVLSLILVQVVMAIVALNTGYRPWVMLVPILGLFISCVNLNIVGGLLELLSLITLLSAMGYDEQANDSGATALVE